MVQDHNQSACLDQEAPLQNEVTDRKSTVMESSTSRSSDSIADEFKDDFPTPRCEELGITKASVCDSTVQAQASLLMVKCRATQSDFMALVDSGASMNFMSKAQVIELGWDTCSSQPIEVKLADGKILCSSHSTSGLVSIGPWQAVVPFQILDLKFNAVLGMPWFKQANPRVDWAKSTIQIKRNGRWKHLPVQCNSLMIDSGKQQDVVSEAGSLSEWLEPVDLKPDCIFDFKPSAEPVITLMSASKFARLMKKPSTEVFWGLLEARPASLNFTHRAAHGDKAELQSGGKRSEKELDALEQAFPSVFSEPTYPIWSNRQPFTLPLIDPAKPPPRRKLYPLSEPELAELRKQLKLLLDSGRIVPSSSPYGHPILFAQKKGGEGLRMCIDYRSLNANVVSDAWPLPRIDELLARLRGARFFSKLDLRDGYHQIPMDIKDRQKTAFLCRYGAFEFTVMTFGHKNAPAHFQRSMNLMLSDLLDQGVIVYLDDILIYTRTEEEHIALLKKVFSRLAEYPFHVKRKKCQLFLEKVDFLGHVVSKDGVAVSTDKVTAVEKWPTPSCVRDIQGFLGLCNYYRRFIRSFARIAQPLTDLTRKEVPFLWSQACEDAFKELKSRLMGAPILQVFDPQAEHEVWCDASDFAVGAVLVQRKLGDKLWLPVEYLSKRLSATESNYSATEREFVALRQALEKWRHYLIGRHFVCKTDHASLRWLQTQPRLSRKQARWLDLLSEFDMEIQHVPGRDNVVPDALSRRADLAAVTEVTSDLLTWIKRAQQEACGDSWKCIQKAAESQERGFLLLDGLVCRRKTRGGTTIVIPEDQELRQFLLSQHHDTPLAGHLGVYRMVGALSQRYYWRGMQEDCKLYCKRCTVCQANKVSTQVPQGLLQPLPTPDYAFEQVTMDLVTHLPVTARGYDSIATFVDRLSKYTYFVPCTAAITAPELAQLFLSTVVAKHGMPRRLISDRDPRFTSQFWQELVRLLGCKQGLSTAYHPESDGQTERMHRSVEQILRCFVSSTQKDWDMFLPTAEFALNSTKSASTGHSPAFVIYGREPTLPLEHAVRSLVDSRVESVAEKVRMMQSTVEVVRQSISRTATLMQQRVNRKRRDIQLNVGDYAWLSTEHLKIPAMLSRKLAARFVGPFLVTKSVGAVSFQLQLPSDWRIHNVFHASQLKPAVGVTSSGSALTPFRPAADDHGEYEVEDILDYRLVRHGRGTSEQFLVKWKGYSIFESTWEPRANLTNCPAILRAFTARRGLRSLQEGE